MQEKKPLLSVCIPTYNRCDDLERCLQSLVCQPEFLQGDVEIVISDNASTDDTESVGRSFADRYDNFHYHRQKQGTNIPDENFPLVMSYGHGVLRKLSNDNLIYQKGSLEYFCDAVRKYHEKRPLLFFTNQEFMNPEYATLGFDRFVRSVRYGLTWIGRFSLWDSDCQGPEFEKSIQVCSTHLWQIERTLHFLELRGGRILDRKFCQPIEFTKKKRTFGMFQVYYTNYFALLEPYHKRGLLSDATMELLKRDKLNEMYGFMRDQDLDCSYLTFSKEENLRELVFDAYKNEPYFPAYKAWYMGVIDQMKQEDKRMHAFCVQHPSFYLYGIGLGTRRVWDRLMFWRIRPKGCIVSPGQVTASSWNGIPVNTLDHIHLENKDGILVTVGKELQSEIRSILEKYGVKDHVFYRNPFQGGPWENR